MNDHPRRLKDEKRCPAHRIAAPRGGGERVMPRLTFPTPRQWKTMLTPKCGLSFPFNAFIPLVVMAADSMLRRAEWAQAGSRRLHDQADTRGFGESDV